MSHRQGAFWDTPAILLPLLQLPVVLSISHRSSRSLNVTRVSVSLQPEMARFNCIRLHHSFTNTASMTPPPNLWPCSVLNRCSLIPVNQKQSHSWAGWTFSFIHEVLEPPLTRLFFFSALVRRVDVDPDLRRRLVQRPHSSYSGWVTAGAMMSPVLGWRSQCVVSLCLHLVEILGTCTGRFCLHQMTKTKCFGVKSQINVTFVKQEVPLRWTALKCRHSFIHIKILE